MALGNRLKLDEIICYSCLDHIDWDATSKALGKAVSPSSYLENPKANDSRKFIPKEGATLTRFTLQIPPAEVIDHAKSDGRENSLGRQAFYLGLRCIRKIENYNDPEDELTLKWTNLTGRERIRLRRANAEEWNKILHPDIQDDLGNTIITEMGFMVLGHEERGEDENF